MEATDEAQNQSEAIRAQLIAWGMDERRISFIRDVSITLASTLDAMTLLAGFDEDERFKIAKYALWTCLKSAEAVHD